MFPSPGKLRVVPGLNALPYARFSLWVMVVVVVLVEGKDNGSHIHHGLPFLEDLPDQPVVPVGAADGKRRQIGPIQTSREREVVDPIGRTHFAVTCGEFA